MNTRRMNRLEELGRVDAEKAFTKKGKRNLKDEKKRIVRELNKKKDGGSLKPVDKEKNPGLAKLPTKVRNKMGYMKDGGKVKTPGGFKSTQQKGNIVKGKLKSQKELKKITGSDAYKKASYGEKTKMLNRATHKVGGRVKMKSGGIAKRGMGCEIR